jgi:phage tail sheath gpL-like
MIARGFNRRHVSLLGGRYFRGIGNRATLTTALAGANNDLTFIARNTGTVGNDITVAIVIDATPSVSVDGTDITITVPSGTTAASVADKVNRSVAASALVWAQVATPGNDGTGAVVAMAATSLSGAS